MPTQTFTHTATAAAPLEKVWASLDRPETWEAIGGVDRVFDPIVDDRGRLRGFSFDSVAGGKKYVGKAVPRQRTEGSLIAWDIENSEVQGVTTVELSPDGDATTVTVTLDVESRGMLATMFFPIVAKAIGNGLPASVDDFAAGFSG